MEHLGTITLESKRLILRKIKYEDSEEIFLGLRNQEEFLYYTNKEKVSLDEQKNSLKDIDEKYKNLDYYNWAITKKDDFKIVGMINFRVNEHNNSVEFNYATDNRYTGNGYMTEALKLVTKFALEELKVNRIQGGCAIENFASKKVMEKCGYNFEGTLKKYLKLKDGYHDMHMFSITN